MEIPEHYFPVRVCPHIGEDERHRFMFADCGSYENVNLKVNDTDESITFLPQRGQESVKNLARNIPSIPLFTAPLKDDDWKEWDHILGMENYNEVHNGVKYLATMLGHKRAAIKNATVANVTKRFRGWSKILKDFYHKEGSDIAQPPGIQPHDLVQMLDKGIRSMYSKYEKAFDVCARKASCLKGYNRDFYGGLLSVLQADCRTSQHVLIHAGGDSFQDIFMTEASCEQGSRLRHAKLLDRLSLDEPVFQIISSNMCMDEGMVCARQKHKCILISVNAANSQLVQKDSTEITEDALTSVDFSPYMKNELLISTDTGGVYLWDINSGSKNHLLVKSQVSDCQDKWSCSYFGGHPRQVVVADNTSVAMFDHRSHFGDGVELFTLSPSLTKKEERVMAATSLGFPFHAVITDYAIFIIDQRFGLAPVFQWSTEFISCPQYVQVLHPRNIQAEQEKILVVASQQPAEVMCFPISLLDGCSPTSSVLPWKISHIGDFCQNSYTSYTCGENKIENRFQTSLAGIAATYQSSQDSCTIYQIDGYGDIFYQSLIHNHGQSLYNLQSCSEEDRQDADKHTENWLRSFNSSVRSNTSQIQCSSVNLAPNIWKDIFRQAQPEDKAEHLQHEPVSTASKKLHKNLKELHKLPSNGSSSKLHLALRENKNILECVQKREDDHTAMKKKMRKINLKMIQTKKKSTNTINRSRVCSSYYCSSDDSDSWQTTSMDTTRHDPPKVNRDQTSFEGIVKTETETSIDNNVNSNSASEEEIKTDVCEVSASSS